MPKDYDNEMKGGLFVNTKKREGKQDPDYTGQCKVRGQEYWVSGWKKRSQTTGAVYMSLAFTLKEGRGAGGAAARKDPPAEQAGDDDSLPF